ncbi:hypothetical protein K488DRAFT_89580 [Vararia minispora EC-137]|uniref:Uncharacterized protein n=1 Tax=Vararia minispora EC-137 TaxID=1314806 RepID=A0ACB8QAI4_9AGAM|nr:hypothetical protein K488DRAFT_89580 [Vararia minispora EC-137]
MALPMLISGAECGPSNALQALTKNFDRDKGLQQDFFGAGRAGSSRETFRSFTAPSPGLGHEVSQFFGGQASVSPPQLSRRTDFDLSALHASLLNSSSAPARALSPPQAPSPVASWATDFLTRPPQLASPSSPRMVSTSPTVQQDVAQSRPQQFHQFHYQQSIIPMLPVAQMHAMPQPAQARMSKLAEFDPSTLEQAFRSHEVSLSQIQEVPPVAEQTPASQPQYDDDLARTAGEVIDAVSHDENPKFKNSQFLSLMRQLRDHDVVVEGNDMVHKSEAGRMSDAPSGGTKGKGKAVDFAHPPTTIPVSITGAGMGREWIGQRPSHMDPNEAYFDAENEEYADYWSAHHSAPERASAMEGQNPWGQLQESWDVYEATSVGVWPVDTSGYSFQTNNPYLLGERSQTNHHSKHGVPSYSFYESVLQLEAAVQREPMDAKAWFDLGVKQQENEREMQALQALRRAVELDPGHLPSWLALAISSTNEGLRQHTIDAVRQWILRNGRYTAIVATHGGPGGTFDSLVSCLLAMVRHAGNELDADVQIALAILLNANEDYFKALDCFQAALAVRPDDWVLYNRVGATLANSGAADEAISYYYRALELNPAYIRARFNLGISCINLSRYDEAAQHILDALVLQDSDTVQGQDSRGVTTASLWDSLRVTCLHMQRTDLISFCNNRDLEGGILVMEYI